ncbi:AAA family ATPase [Anoxybacteroides amylolyticum]|uniref:Nuclease SbcCD subunit C n=1 Tax=Anoxybacteroides amylolyticum TaxID=294699 RepID=A0A167TDU4_9BACL|nr:SbcC/MukB-like Walker B domain-containing protein [Anoxybacillus amylolyticus]ANB60260.1 AAA domain protein [Anoxybacillus amylolyticus]
MKPICLTVAGLHSFREKQVIDFKTLCEGGLFGIFGPTGSGKSSILDAMTLALYGNVERAANNTHGIMNHAENELSVAFTFELVNANGKKRYTVERTFKRSDEWRVKTSVSRLIEEGTERIVIADKMRDVDEWIRRLLGLEMKDFTRAVVLPQGKFAEFLSLKGVERRQMLQRLFNLERYGDELNEKLKTKLAMAAAKLDTIRAEQAGLGDASQAALAEQKRELEELARELARQKAHVAEITEQYERKKQLWQWQQEKQYAEQQIAKCYQEEERIATLERKQKKAEKAERLLPYWQQYEQTKQEVEKWEKELEATEQKLHAVRKQYEQAAEAYQLIRAKKAEEEPKWLEQKERLVKALQLLERMKSVAKEIDESKKKLTFLNEKEKQIKQALHELDGLYERALEKQKRLKEAWQQKQVDMQQKARIYKAYEAKKEWQALERALHEAQAEWQQKQKQHDELTKTIQVEMERSEAIVAKERAHFQRIEKLYHTVCEHETKLEKLLYKIKQAQKKAEQERMLHAASLLAASLHEGSPCPVCGATHHPNPAQPVATGNGHFSEEEQPLEQAQQLVAPLQTLKTKVQQLAELLAPEEVPLGGTEKMKREESDQDRSFIEQVTYLSVELKALQQDYVQCREETTKLLNERKAVDMRRQELLHQQAALAQEINERREKYNERLQMCQTQLKQWQEIYQDLAFDTIEQTMEQLQHDENEAQLLQERIEKSVHFLEEKKEERERWKEQWQQLEREKAEYMTLYQTKQKQYETYAQDLPFPVEEAAVAQLLNETEQQLVKLQQQETETYERWTNVQKQYQALEANYKAAQLAFSESQKRKEQAEADWHQQLEKNSWSESDDIRQALLTAEEKIFIAEQITQHRDKQLKWQNEWQRLTRMMNGEEITEEQWRQIEQLRMEEDAKLTECIERTASAKAKMEELEEKHTRFQELEQERIEVERLVRLYNELQRVLRGNSFVEFIAEEQLIRVTRDASERLGALTRQRYAIEVDSEGGFIIRDDANGGVRRPVTTLSGGETFLTSLSLALALSKQIQLRGEYPLQFFFLDEGFGTLDNELLDIVITALERLQTSDMAIGVISHVQELRARLPKRLVVEPAEPSGRGTRVRLETM